MKKSHRIIVTLLRVALALVFIFSGFVKAVDPWGTALKLGEYFSAFGVEWLSPAKFVFSVMLSGLELAMGLALLFSVRLKISSLLVMLFMAFFTVLTLVSAVWDTVDDCGCFGDVVKLTNWETFFKNLVLLPISVLVWLYYKSAPERRCCKADLIVAGVILLLSFGIGVYSLRHLPLIDFLPYKVGTDLAAARSGADIGGEVETTLIYRDRQSGKQHEFTLADTTWYDDTRWEFVDTKIVHGKGFEPSPAREFAVFNGSDDITEEMVFGEGKTYLLFMTALGRASAQCMEKLGKAVLDAQHDHARRIYVVTPSPVTPGMTMPLGASSIECYNIDGTLMKTILRAHYGLVVIEDGVIVEKKNCKDI